MLAGTALHAWCLFTLEFDGPNSGKHLDSILALAVACAWHAGRPQGIHSASFCNRRWHVPRPKQSIFRHGMAASSILCVASTIATGCLPAAACPVVKVGIGFMPTELSNLDGQLCGSNVEVEQQISFLRVLQQSPPGGLWANLPFHSGGSRDSVAPTSRKRHAEAISEQRMVGIAQATFNFDKK